MLTLINPDTNTPFPSAQHAGRLCFAVPAGSRFAVLAFPNGVAPHNRYEVVLAVDGRDVMSNRDASPELPGLVLDGPHVFKGFRVDAGGEREFVCSALGRGSATAERNGTAHCAGLIAAVAYRERPRRDHFEPSSMHTFGMRGGGLEPSRGPARGESRGSVGAAAGEYVENRIGTTSFVRGSTDPQQATIIEYDTFEGWAARGIVIPAINMSNPWPGAQATRFAVNPL